MGLPSWLCDPVADSEMNIEQGACWVRSVPGSGIATLVYGVERWLAAVDAGRSFFAGSSMTVDAECQKGIRRPSERDDEARATQARAGRLAAAQLANDGKPRSPSSGASRTGRPRAPCMVSAELPNLKQTQKHAKC